MRSALFALLTAPLITPGLFAQTAGTINTIAGTGGALFSGDGGLATLAGLNVAVDVSADRAGNLYIADQFNHRIRRIAPNGVITTVAGTGVPGYSGDGGLAVNAQINTPTGVFADNAGNFYIAEPGNQRIRKVDPTGIITTIAGNGSKGYSGDGGPAINASLYNAVRVAVDPGGNVVIADQSNHRIRRISASGIITTIAGNGVGTPATGAFSGDGGQATAASLNNPTALAINPAGVIYFADQFNQRIRRITTDGTITTIAGNGNAGFSGDGGAATAASLNYPGGMTLDAAGNIYCNDDLNFRTRKIDVSSGVISTVAGNGVAGFSGDGGPATSASLSGNFGAAVDTLGNLYIADSTNNRIREVYGAAAPGSVPAITSGGVVPIFSSSTTVQPGSWVSIFGNNLATGTTIWNNDFPTTLGGISVTIDGKLAYLWYVSPTQINLQAPDDGNTGASVKVVLTTPTGIATSTVTLGQFGPSFSVLDGKHVAGIILRSDGSGAYGGGTYDILGPTGTSLGYKTVAAKAGDTLELFGVGFGPTTPSVPAGKAFTASAQTNSPVVVSINGNSVNPAFAGLTSAGLYQINLVTIPAGLGTGDVALLATVGGVQTQTGVLLSLQ
jgi:uncharacterized protein (TIGR03437 family)